MRAERGSSDGRAAYRAACDALPLARACKREFKRGIPGGMPYGARVEEPASKTLHMVCYWFCILVFTQ